MTDQNRFSSVLLDDMARLATTAAGVAQSARDEVETLLKSRMERWLNDRNFVTREEFDAVAEMARLAREENERLAKRLEELEQRTLPTS